MNKVESNLRLLASSRCSSGLATTFTAAADEIARLETLAKTATASENERCLIGYREIAVASDWQMRDGDFAREVAARMLGAER